MFDRGGFRVKPPDPERTNGWQKRWAAAASGVTDDTELVRLAVDRGKCDWAQFPRDVEVPSVGYFSHHYCDALRGDATIHDKSPAASSANSYFLTRTSNEGLMLRTLMRYLMPQDVLNSQEQRLQTKYLSSVDSWKP